MNEADRALPAVHITDRLANLGAEPNEAFESKRPDNYNPLAEKHHYEKVLTQVDFRDPRHAASS